MSLIQLGKGLHSTEDSSPSYQGAFREGSQKGITTDERSGAEVVNSRSARQLVLMPIDQVESHEMDVKGEVEADEGTEGTICGVGLPKGSSAD